jgi:1,4-alpha-glucan branching enzyme
VSSRRDRGALAIVLHTHMPYVEGFGTWPFGEEWLWEAIAGSYLPMLELLDRGAPLTLSLTPVLCDQLEAPGVPERFVRFIGGVRRVTHAMDAEGTRVGGHEQLALEVERSWADYELALERFSARGGDLLASFERHVQWTSAATHAVLPLLATDEGVGLQVRSGVGAHRARFGSQGWRGGFWLPECAHAPWLEPLLADAGVRATCVELTGRFGLGAREHLRPLLGESGVALVPIDRATMNLVWSEHGYPAGGAYRDYHKHTIHHHKPWSNDGAIYDRGRALAQVGRDAADFVARTRERLRDGSGQPGGGLAVCALDTELLGHWWYEGVDWLGAVIEECSRQSLELVRLDDALERLEPTSLIPQAAPAREAERFADDATSSWGAGGNLSTWSGPRVAEIAFTARRLELELVSRRARAGGQVDRAAVRELLALQASDWAFIVTRKLAGSYALERVAGHRDALEAALSGGRAGGDSQGLRNLAVHAVL